MNRDYLNKLAATIWKDLCYWTREVRRLWVPLLAMAIIGHWRRQLLEDDQFSETARILYKVNIVAGAVVLWHMLRSQILYYVNFGDFFLLVKTVLRLVASKEPDPTKFLGACQLLGLLALSAAVLIGSMAIGIILGFTMGL